MHIDIVSILVRDQADALRFYTEVLGFQKKEDIPMGEHRWLTFVSPESPDGPELSVEPIAFPPAATYQKALHEAGIPATAFRVDDIAAEHERLTGLGVEFSQAPTEAGPVILAVFDDTCGNRIQIYQIV